MHYAIKLPLCIVVMFYVCEIPALAANVIDAVGEHYSPLNSFKQRRAWSNVMAVANLLVVLNSAANFLIYYLNSRTFRENCQALITRRPFKKYSLG